MLYAVIIAGGSGKRLWPKSRRESPKFLLKLRGKNSLLQDTAARLKGLVPADNIVIVTNAQHAAAVHKELPNLPKRNIIGEPLSKNTAPAVCIAASFIRKKDPNAVLLIMPADQVMEDDACIREILRFTCLIARLKDSIVTIGIKPTYAATGYGYIKTGKLYKRLNAKKPCDTYKVDRFIEKPSLIKAKGFLRSKNHLWNSGIFIGRAEVFLNEFKKYKPAVYRVAMKIDKALGTKRQQSALKRHYSKFPDVSIDYAIMEKTKNAYVVKSDMRWKDIGSWKSIDDYLGADSKGNVISGDSLCMDVKDSVIIGEKGHLIAALGLKGMVIVNTDNATLICPKDRAEDVKRLVELAQAKRLYKYL